MVTYPSCSWRMVVLAGLAWLAADGLLPASAAADVLRAQAELSYSEVRQDISNKGNIPDEERDSEYFRQRYSLMVDKQIYPMLSLNASGVYETTDSETTDDGESNESTITRINENLRLSLGGAVLSGAASYSRREVENEFNSFTPPKDIVETYSANLSWRPYALPTLFLQYDHINSYDADRSVRDQTTDRVALGLSYDFSEALSVDYFGDLVKNDNRINGIEIETATNTGSVEYQENFLANRLQVSARNTYTHRENTLDRTSDTIVGGSILLPFEGYDATGYAALSAPGATLVPLQRLNSLSDDRFEAPGDALTNVGSAAPDHDLVRNLGLGFIFEQNVDALRVWVDRELPPSLAASSFGWQVYASNDNATWGIPLIITAISYNRVDDVNSYFELRFTPTGSTEYIKVVMSPLSMAIPVDPSFDTANIYITEIRAFRSEFFSETNSETISRSFTNWSNVLDTTVRYQLLEDYAVYYELSTYYGYNHGETGSQDRYTITNSISGSHPLNQKLMASARLAREDSVDASDEHLASNIYSAGLQIQSLPTLSHSINFSGLQEEGGDDPVWSNTLFVTNSARLYRGIDVYLNGGVGHSEQDSGAESDSATLLVGATVQPNVRLTVTANHSLNWSESQGGDLPDQENTINSSYVSIAYAPFATLSLFGSMNYTTSSELDDQTGWEAQVSYTPSLTGNLFFSLGYNYDETSDGIKTWNLSPYVRYKLNPRIFVEASYSWAQSTQQTFEEDVQVLFISLNMRYDQI